MELDVFKIHYKGGYKYQLQQDYFDRVLIKPPAHIEHGYIVLSTNGVLMIERGYSWDGPSGITFDTKSSMRASLVHDALYQLIRNGCLMESDREAADFEFYERCIEDRMWKFRAKAWFRALRLGGGPAADPNNKKKVREAP